MTLFTRDLFDGLWDIMVEAPFLNAQLKPKTFLYATWPNGRITIRRDRP